MELHTLPIHLLDQKRKNQEISTYQIVEAVLQRVKACQEKLNTYLYLSDSKTVLEKAQKVDQEIQKGNTVHPLAGMPIGLKDIFVTKGIPSTCASKILENFIPPYESTVSQQLSDVGYNLIGKLNMDEFAMGASNENSAFGVVRNPWSLDKVPGGSSGGSAAAVAAGLCSASIGTDTGGSIRQPASYTSTVGLKPTYGRVSRYGMIAFASSLDQAGPITKDVTDAALLLEAISSYDEKDSTSANIETPQFYKALKSVKPSKIGIISNLDLKACNEQVIENYQKNLALFEQHKVEIVPIEIPLIHYTVATYYIIACSEASSNLGRYDGIRYGKRSDSESLFDLYQDTRSKGFGSEVKLRILAGTFALSTGYYDAYFLKANKVRAAMTQQVREALEKVDFLVTPVSPMPAFNIGEVVQDPIRMYLLDALTIPANLGGFPALSIPAGFVAGNLPVGLHFLGKHFQEQDLLNYALWFEQNCHFEKPPMAI